MLNLGSKLRVARQAKGLSQEELAKIVGTTKSAISRYESNKRQPNLQQLRHIAKALDADVVYLISGQTTEEVQRGIIIDADMELRTILENLQTKSESKSFDEQVAWRNTVAHVLKLLDGFNATGWKKAIERLEELAEVPNYRRQDNSASDTVAITETPKEEI